MIEIINKKPNKYFAKCPKCDCELSYQWEDLRKDYYEKLVIICPECDNYIYHDSRINEKNLNMGNKYE